MSEKLKYIPKPKGRESKANRQARLENNRKVKEQKELNAKQQTEDLLDDQVPEITSNTNETIEDSVDVNTDDSDQLIQEQQSPLENIAYSPFSEPVKKRAYTVPNIDASELSGELEVPIYTAPTFDDLDNSSASEEADVKQPKKEPTQFNEAFSELPNKEKQMGAEMMADVVLDGYSKLGNGIGSLAKISEEKLEREYADETIDPKLQLPIDESGNTVSVREFVEAFNQEASTAFETTDEFKEKVRPPLIRVFKKRGVGMTDEQQLIYFFGTDIASKGFTAFQLKKASNGILDQLRQQTDFLRDNANSQKRSSSTTATSSPSSTNSNEKSKEVVHEAKSYVEPEETTSPIVVSDSEAIIVKESSGFAKSKTADNMPEFGDQDLLDDMQKLAEREEKRNNENKA